MNQLPRITLEASYELTEFLRHYIQNGCDVDFGGFPNKAHVKFDAGRQCELVEYFEGVWTINGDSLRTISHIDWLKTKSIPI